MGPRATETERLKHKVLIRLNDDLHGLRRVETGRRFLAPSIVAGQILSERLSEIRGNGEETGRQNGQAVLGASEETTQ